MVTASETAPQTALMVTMMEKAIRMETARMVTRIDSRTEAALSEMAAVGAN